MEDPTCKKLMYAVLIINALVPVIAPEIFVQCMTISLIILAILGIADLFKKFSN